jgi:hypothetical protein
MERTTVAVAREARPAHQHEVTRTGDPPLDDVVRVTGSADRERRSTVDGDDDHEPSVPLPVHVRRDADRARHVVGDTDLVRGPRRRPSDPAAIRSDACPDPSAQAREQREGRGREVDVVAVDLLPDRTEGLPERSEWAGVELLLERLEERAIDARRHPSVPEPGTRPERRTEIETGNEAIPLRHDPR